jgi:hypothetical protein
VTFESLERSEKQWRPEFVANDVDAVKLKTKRSELIDSFIRKVVRGSSNRLDDPIEFLHWTGKLGQKCRLGRIGLRYKLEALDRVRQVINLCRHEIVPFGFCNVHVIDKQVDVNWQCPIQTRKLLTREKLDTEDGCFLERTQRQVQLEWHADVVCRQVARDSFTEQRRQNRLLPGCNRKIVHEFERFSIMTLEEVIFVPEFDEIDHARTG